jgi:pilus assembly protein Flp/PilA
VIPFLSREEGQGLIEYALIIVLVAIVVIAILLLLWDRIYDLLDQFLNFIS